MWFIYLVVGLSLILYIRFFINNSLQHKLQRKQTLHAAIKVLYFGPVFQQAFFLFCISFIYFYSICKGFFLFIADLVTLKQEFELDFLWLVGFIGIATLLLCCNFVLAKISMNKKMDAVNVFYKIAYLLLSAITFTLTYLNLPLLYPFYPSVPPMIFYDNAFVIILTVLAYMVVLVVHYLYPKKSKVIEYFQLTVRISLTYILLNFSLALLVFVVYFLLKIIA